ncbi:MAG: cysteine desulfurase [Methanospirillum sp.]
MLIETCRNDFPLLSHLHYLDSASVSLTPVQVADVVREFDLEYRANVGRGVHRLARMATLRYEEAHRTVARFIHGEKGSLVATKNTTEAINMVSLGLPWAQGDRIVTTRAEHHSNLLPWIRLRERGVEVTLLDPLPDGTVPLEAFETAVDDRTRLVAVTQASNVLGSIAPVRSIGQLAHDHGARILVDGAQSVPHLPVDVVDLGCDFLAFSGHKMLGPMATGVLWMREPVIEPLLLGGGMVEAVSEDTVRMAAGAGRYEAGTPNVSGMLGLARAVEYLETIGMDAVRAHEEVLTARLVDGLSACEGVRVLGPDGRVPRIGVVAFDVDGYHPHDVAHVLDEAVQILVRSGHHCCQPLMEHCGCPEGAVRASLYLYNTAEEVDLLAATVSELVRMG